MKRFFASQNTCGGFVSRFDGIFDESLLDGLYIIKGGPGTGKSRLMKMIAEKWGDEAEVFLCSSDPDSLDGVMSQNKKTAVIDGTAPHTADTKYPGAVSRIINTGEFWNENALKNSRQRIIELNRQKAACCLRAYTLLSAAGKINESRRKTALEGFDGEKMKRAAARLAASFKAEGKSQSGVRLNSTFNHTGLMKLRSFERAAKTRILVQDTLKTGDLFITELLNLTRRAGTAEIVSYSPVDLKPDGVYYPDLEISVTRDDRPSWEKEFVTADRYVNMDRFIDRSAKRKNRAGTRFYNKCFDSLVSSAAEEFSKARTAHLEIEEIYTASMDFAALSQFQNEIVSKL